MHARKMLKEILTEGGGKWIKPSGSNDKRVLCTFCARCMPAVPTNLNIQIATDCALDHPACDEAALAVVGSKTALKRLGKDKQDLLNKIKEEYTLRQRPLYPPSTSRWVEVPLPTPQAEQALA